MSWLEFISKVMEITAWPIAIAIVAFWFKDKIVTLLLRLISIKYKDFAIQFAEATKGIIDESASAEEKAEWKRRQIIHETPYYKLYSNGILVQKLTLKILPNTTQRQLIFPITFPNEVLSIQQSGGIGANVVNLTPSNCDLTFSSSSAERELHITISGI